MKKLLLAMGCFAAMIVISSCSADSLEEVKKENLITPSQTAPSATVDALPGVDDKDKAQG
jgi:hypothetical protein